MRIKKFLRLYKALSRNPDKLEEDIPYNYADLHENTIDYHLASEIKNKEVNVHLLVKVKPKDIKTGFVNYEASYEIQLDLSAKEYSNDLDSAIKWGVGRMWNDVTLDYITAMHDLNLPITGFPPDPLVPSFYKKEGTDEAKSSDK